MTPKRSTGRNLDAWISGVLSDTEGIEDVRVLVRDDSSLDGVLVRLEDAAAAPDVRRALLSAVQAESGLELDPSAIYVSFDAEMPQASTDRVVLGGVDLSVEADRARVRVRLASSKGHGVGLKEGLGTRTGLARLVAQATVDAVVAMGQELGQVSVECVTFSDAIRADGPCQLVTVLLTVSLAGVRRELVGSAIVRFNEAETTARATLAALNRLIG